MGSIIIPILNTNEFQPYDFIKITRTWNQRQDKPEIIVCKGELVKYRFLEKRQTENVDIIRIIIVNDRTITDSRTVNLGVKLGRVYGSSPARYAKVTWDIDFMFVLSDGRMVETNVTSEQNIKFLFPLLRQQENHDQWIKARKSVQKAFNNDLNAKRQLLKEKIKAHDKSRHSKLKENSTNNTPTGKTLDVHSSNVNELWKNILIELTNFPQDVQTIRQNGSFGLWFFAQSQDGFVYVSNAKHNTPSSSLKVPVQISQEEFVKVYPYFSQWKNDIISRQDVAAITQKSSYIFAIVYKFCN